MADTVRTLSALQSLLADNTTGAISAQDVRDFLVSAWTPEHIRYLHHRLPDETPHTDDDLFDADSSGDYTNTTVSGTASWAVARGRYLVTADDQTAEDMAVALKAITSASAPMTIETAVRWENGDGNSPSVGLVFADGTTATDNQVRAAIYNQTTGNWFTLAQGTLTAHGSGAGDHNLGNYTHTGLMYLQLIWKAANTWKARFGVSETQWHDPFGDFSDTMTPTHLGFYVSTWGDNEPIMAAFEYLRVYDEDRSA